MLTERLSPMTKYWSLPHVMNCSCTAKAVIARVPDAHHVAPLRFAMLKRPAIEQVKVGIPECRHHAHPDHLDRLKEETADPKIAAHAHQPDQNKKAHLTRQSQHLTRWFLVGRGGGIRPNGLLWNRNHGQVFTRIFLGHIVSRFLTILYRFY